MDGHPPGFSVVIPSYGPDPRLADGLAALERQTLAPHEIIVSHSGPGDPAGALADRFPQVRFLHDDARHYAGSARNRGAALAGGDWLAFLDSDVIPRPTWLAALAGAARETPDAVLVGSIGRLPGGGAWSRAMWFICCGSALPHRSKQRLRSAPGASFTVPSGAFAAAGGFNPNIFAAEDGDLSARLAAAGHPILLIPEARVDHPYPGGMQRSLARLHKLGRASAYLRRHRELPGSIVVRHPGLALLLPPVRLGQILKRLLTERGPVFEALLLSPLILGGLIGWSIGFWREARAPAYPAPQDTGFL